LLARNGIYARLCRSQTLLDLGGGIHDNADAPAAAPTEAA
jgi:hypothetical protein